MESNHNMVRRLRSTRSWRAGFDAMTRDGKGLLGIPDTPESLSPEQHELQTSHFEEDELPEDGEIQDDEDAEMQRKFLLSQINETGLSDAVVNNALNTPLPLKPQSSCEQIEHHILSRPPDREISPKERHEPGQSRSPACYGPPTIPIRRWAWTENVLCKFFREGYCRDGTECSYSHNAALSNRKPELCKYYSQGFCKKGLACTLLHGEYPCKEFHRGQCMRKPCKYSHMPLNDCTQPIYDQILQDESIAAQIKIPHIPTRRRTLLAKPPANWGPQKRQSSSPLKKPYLVETMKLTAYDAHSMPPAFKIRDNFTAATAAEDPDELLMAGDDYRKQSEVAYQQNFEEIRSFVSPTTVSATVPTTAPGILSLNDMLNQLASVPSEVNVQKVVSNFFSNEEIAKTQALPERPPEVYMLIPFNQSYKCYDKNMIKKLSFERFKNDPRAAAVKKQFEQNLNMMSISLPPASSTAPTPAVVRDPRLRNAMPTDPRVQRTLRSSGGLLPTPVPLNPQPTNSVNPATSDFLADQHFQSLIEKQLQMVNHVNQYSDPERPSSSQHHASRSRHYEDEYYRHGHNNSWGGVSNNQNYRNDYDDYQNSNYPRSYEDSGYRGRPSHYSGPRGGYRGSFHEEHLDRYRSGPSRSEHQDPGSFNRRDYRINRDPYPRHRDNKYDGYRSRSRSPIRPSRSGKSYNGYQSPETRA